MTRAGTGKTTGLGRGLGALIPTAPAAGGDEVDIDLIAPNPEQPRQHFDEAALTELADSIREHGLLQPLVVSRLSGADGVAAYQLIAGERRLLAARRAGLRRLPVVVRETTPQGLLELALVENVQRADLGPLEEARAYQRLSTEFGLTQEDIARRVGRARVSVANTMRLLGLPPVVQQGLAAGQITEGHARAILGMPGDAPRVELFEQVVAKDLTVRQTEELVRRLREQPAPPAAAAEVDAAVEPVTAITRAPSFDPDLAAIEERLRQSLGTQVHLERGRKGGRIIIQFYGDEDLESLIARLLGELSDL